MAAIVNDRDVLMQATTPRVVSGGASKGIILSASSSAFQVSTAGVGSPSSITLTAALIGIAGAAVTFSTSPTTTLGVSGNVATLAYANMSANSVAVTATVVDGGVTYSNTQTITKLNALGALATQSAVDLATQVTGMLSSSGVSGLGALAALNYINLNTQAVGSLPYTSVSGLGALALKGQIDPATDFSAGTIAANVIYGGTIAATQIAAGTLAAGVVYAGTVNASQVNAGTFTGQTYKTSGSGTYVGLNEYGNNKLVYYIGGSSVCEIGGSSGIIWATSSSSLSSTISGIATGPLNGVTGSAGSGNGVHGISSSGTGVRATGPTAIYADGLITMPSRTPGVNNTALNSIIASTNNTYQCGYTGNAWQNVYTYGVINPSDIRIKENIQDLGDGNFGLDFIRKLRPISYTMIVGSNDIEVGPEQMGPWMGGQAPEREVIVIPRKGTRTHLGLPAQNVREAAGRGDVAIWSLADKDDPDSAQSVSYIELVAPTIKAVQQLDAIVQQLRDEIKTLKAANA
jgi:hypothetical protein